MSLTEEQSRTVTPHVVNRTQLADILGVTTKTVDRFIQQGLPVASRPVRRGYAKGLRIRSSAAIAWYIDRLVSRSQQRSPSGPRQRKLLVAAQLAEHKLGEMRAQYVSRADADAAWRTIQEQACARLERIPALLAPIVARVSDPNEVVKLLSATIRQALTELAQPDPIPNVPEESTGR